MQKGKLVLWTGGLCSDGVLLLWRQRCERASMQRSTAAFLPGRSVSRSKALRSPLRFPGRACEGVWASLDREGDEAVVVRHVALEDLCAGTQDSLKAGPVQLDALEGAPRYHSGCTRSVQEQRYLSKVV